MRDTADRRLLPDLLRLIRPRTRYRTLFRWGQAATREDRRGALVSAWRDRGTWLAEDFPTDNDITPGVMIVQKDAEADRTWVWIGAVLRGRIATTICTGPTPR